MNPFDGLTKRQHELVEIALSTMKLFAWGGDNPPPKEKEEYEELITMLANASIK